MSANMAPALVRSSSDLVIYNVSDAEPENANAPRGFIERYIHSEMYKRYPGVLCVIHSHADDVLPYTVSGVKFKAMNHMAGFIGEESPLFDIGDEYQEGDHHDLLVSTPRLGAALASSFVGARHDNPEVPEQSLLLMRRHGFTTWGRGIKEAVYRAVYATKNASLQTTATLLRSASDSLEQKQASEGSGGKPTQGSTGAGWDTTKGEGPLHPLESLTAQQAKDTEAANLKAVERPWGLWVQEVKCLPLYTSSVYRG